MEKNILVVGGGAIGGMIAAYMIEAEYKVTLYDTDKEHVKRINEKGLLIEGFKEKKKIKIPSTTKLTDSYDVVFLSVKSNHTKEAIKTFLPHLKENSLVVSMQNGINEDTIAEMIGEKRTIGAVIGWGCTNVEAGHLKQTSEGNNIIGMLDGSINSNLEEIKKMLETFTTTEITNNIYGHLWTKLLINCNVASLGVIFGSEIRQLIKNKDIIPIMVGLTNELVTVAQSSGVRLEKFENILDVNLLKVNSFNDYKRAVAIIKIAGEKHQLIKSTIWQDIEKGRKTEIDFLNGYIEKKAEQFGIPTPINSTVLKLVKQIENGKIKPTIKNINDFYKQVRIPKIWRDYNFDEDPFRSFALFNLTSNQKHKQAADLNGAHLIGILIAFSKTFDKLTKSIIGKLFIRKTTWDIINFVNDKYLFEIGKTFSERVISSFEIKKRDVMACVKVFVFYLNSLYVNYTFKIISEKKIQLNIESSSDSFTQMAKNLKVDKNIKLPLFESFFKGIIKNINESINLSCSKKILNEKEVYQITIEQ
jgi:2-dehydropantoate 2-reductase